MEQPVKPYVWHICRPNFIKMVKKLGNATGNITSDGLQVNGINFYFTLEFTNTVEGNSVAVLYLSFMHLPSFIEAFEFEYNIDLKEANIQKYLRSEFKKEYYENNQQLCRHIMSKENFNKLKSFTFIIQLRIIRFGYNSNYRHQIHQLVKINKDISKLPKVSYGWNINRREDVQLFQSLTNRETIVSESFNIYGIKCHLFLSPDHQNIFNTRVAIKFPFLSDFVSNNI
eukprot:UN12824